VLGGLLVALVVLAGTLVLYYRRRELAPGYGEWVRIGTVVVLVIVGSAATHWLGRGLYPRLYRRLDPAPAGTIGFLLRLLAPAPSPQRPRSSSSLGGPRGRPPPRWPPAAPSPRSSSASPLSSPWPGSSPGSSCRAPAPSASGNGCAWSAAPSPARSRARSAPS